MKQGAGEEDKWLPGTGNSSITWRRPNLKYSRNEIKFYIIEYINATVTQYSLTPSLHPIEKVNTQIAQDMVLYVLKAIFPRTLRLLLFLVALILLKGSSFIPVLTDLASTPVKLYSLFLQMVFSMYVQ